MSEGIVGGAIRGLGTMFKLRGNIFAPQGIELSRAIIPIADVTQLGRYGAAHGFADGWAWFRTDDGTVGAQTQSQTIAGWESQAGAPKDDLIGWVYDAFVTSDYETAASEAGLCYIRAAVPITGRFGGGSKNTFDLFLSDGVQDIVGTGQALCVNRLRPRWPLPWFRGADLFTTVQGLTAAKTINWEMALLMRFMPVGVPPLP